MPAVRKLVTETGLQVCQYISISISIYLFKNNRT